MKESPLKRMPKAEFAKEIGVSSTTLQKMLNVEFIEELSKLRYRPTQKYITLAQKQRLEEVAVNANL